MCRRQGGVKGGSVGNVCAHYSNKYPSLGANLVLISRLDIRAWNPTIWFIPPDGVWPQGSKEGKGEFKRKRKSGARQTSSIHFITIQRRQGADSEHYLVKLLHVSSSYWTCLERVIFVSKSKSGDVTRRNTPDKVPRPSRVVCLLHILGESPSFLQKWLHLAESIKQRPCKL